MPMASKAWCRRRSCRCWARAAAPTATTRRRSRRVPQPGAAGVRCDCVLGLEMETTSGEEPLTELSVDEAVSIAVQLHQRGFLDEAQTVYERILKIEPDQADAMHFLGVLLHQRDRSDAAIDLIEKSIALAPQVPDRYNNLGNVLVE